MTSPDIPPPPSPPRVLTGSLRSFGFGTSSRESTGLIDRIMERKRLALGDLSNSGMAGLPLQRERGQILQTSQEPASPDEKVAVQRFTLVSRGAPPAKRARVQHNVLVAPPRVAAQLGQEIQVCRCSECDRSGLRRRLSTGRRLCRRDTESHPEYSLLLAMSERFEAECPSRGGASSLVGEACCREKTAYFILGPGLTTIGYVAAEVAANRRVRKLNESFVSEAEEQHQVAESPPVILQIYVEPDYRRRGFATEALQLLTRDHWKLIVDDPPQPVLHILARLGFVQASSQDGPEGRPMVSLVKNETVNV